ncbi:MAG: transglutaminase [Zoogloea sp.]|nr:transglutaminase [Zoogloea sp.]
MWKPRLRLVCLLILGIAGLAVSGVDIERMRQIAFQRFGPGAVVSLDEWRGLIASARNTSQADQLRRVNEFFNRRIRFDSDQSVWGVVDYWATPLEFLGRGAGDCEDYAISKYFTLRELGVPESRLRITYVRAQIGGPSSGVSEAHMVLSYYPTPDAVPFILDNLISDIRSASARPDLTPVFSFNMQGIFAAGAAQASTPVERVSRWRELMLRMKAEGYEP